MYTLSTIALGLLAAIPSISAAPMPVASGDIVARACGKSYSGPASNFPAKTQWKSFDTIFNANKHNMQLPNNGDSDSDVSRLHSAIQSVAKSTGVEDRVLLSIVLQESNGNVGVVCTPANNPTDCGLMQVRGGPGFPGKHNLSQDQITSMVKAGADHFKGNMATFGGQDTASVIYRALRAYNSGSVNESNLSDGKGATPSYVSDIANRLLGVVC